MSYKMSKSAFKELIKADIEYLKTMCIPTLERRHIINVLNDYVNIAYPKKALDGLKKSNKIMPKVRAKFVCVSNEQKEGEQHQVKLNAVMQGSEENKSFSRWTPVANLEMWISDETPAAQVFEQGKEYYVDFTPAD